MPTRRLTCAVGVCNNYYYKTREMLDRGLPITYHYFPKNVYTCNRWIEACNRSDFFKAEISFICSIHFEPDDFVNHSDYSISLPSQRKLKCNAIPTKNLTWHSIKSYYNSSAWKKNHDFLTDDTEIEANHNCSGEEPTKDTIMKARINESLHSRTSKNLGPLKRKYGQSKNCEVDSESDNRLDKDSVVDNLNITVKKDFDYITAKYDKLLKDYKEYEDNSNMEIRRLNQIITEKDEDFNLKLKQILSNYLKDTEIDLVMYLRKQKSENS